MSSQGSNPTPIRLLLLPALLAMGLAGCGTPQRPGIAPPSSAAPQEDSNWRGRQEVGQAIALLNRGEAAAARVKLMEVLRGQPGDDVARQLLRQIDTDPRELLGRENYSYTLREGETLSTVAQRALGNPMLFYALARYNNIAVPESARAGQTILVPGRRRAPPPRAEPRPTPTRPAPPPEATTPRPAPRAGNPAQAARLRAQGLAAMNGGQINRAVALLRQALALDPGNGVIRNDLDRALRVQSTLRSRR